MEKLPYTGCNIFQPTSSKEIWDVFGSSVYQAWEESIQTCKLQFAWMCDKFGVEKYPQIYSWPFVENPSRRGGFFTRSKDLTTFYIYLSVPYLKLVPQRIMEEVIPHELSHAFHTLYNEKVSDAEPHGKEFEEIMYYFFHFCNLSFSVPPDLENDRNKLLAEYASLMTE